MLDTLAFGLQRLSRLAAIIAGFMVLAAALIVFVDVILRSVADTTLGGADELSGYALAIGTTWAMPYCLLGKFNIRVDTLYRVFSPRLRALLDIFGLLALGGFGLLLTYRGGLVLIETIDRSSRSVGPLSMPQVYPQTLWIIGLTFFTIAFTVTLLRCLVAISAGDIAKVQKIVGTRDQQAEISDSVTT